MRGIILAGGNGTRLLPLTKIINKHLLPIFNKPMIYYPLQTLVSVGVKSILIVSGPNHAGQFLNLLGSGRKFGVKLSYEIQEEAGGIAQALSLAEDFSDNSKITVVLGDNVFEDNRNIKRAAREFEKQRKGAKIFLKEIKDANRFGVAEIKGDKIVGIVEKPRKPKSNLAVTGLYMYDKNVFNIIRKLKPSKRGEFEITDVNNAYIKQKTMTFSIVKKAWVDAGTFDSLLSAANIVADRK